MKLKSLKVHYLFFFCPGCKCQHTYSVNDDGTGWQFNGDIEKPTFTPSLFNRDFDTEGKVKSICHLFLTDGKIQFLNDCTHDLKGQTVEMKDI